LSSSEPLFALVAVRKGLFALVAVPTGLFALVAVRKGLGKNVFRDLGFLWGGVPGVGDDGFPLSDASDLGFCGFFEGRESFDFGDGNNPFKDLGLPEGEGVSLLLNDEDFFFLVLFLVGVTKPEDDDAECLAPWLMSSTALELLRVPESEE
jgi:hypothetical protein